MKRTIIFVFLFLILGPQVFASERQIVVLTSLETPDRQPFWRSKNYEISRSIERRFRSKLKNLEYKIVFEHNANAVVLESYLTSPQTLALFWVSHAVDAGGGPVGLEYSQSIFDVFGNNVADLFKRIHPNMRWLSIIGCKGRPILERYHLQGFYDLNSGLVLQSFDRNISLRRGINQATAQALDHLENMTSIGSFSGTNLMPTLDSPYQISIIPHLNDDFAGALFIGDYYLGLLRANEAVTHFAVPESLVRREKAKLTVRWLVLNELEEITWPADLYIETSGSRGPQRFFADWNGLIYGGQQNLYYLEF